MSYRGGEKYLSEDKRLVRDLESANADLIRWNQQLEEQLEGRGVLLRHERAVGLPVCDRCGAVVANGEAHAGWHAMVDDLAAVARGDRG